MAPGRMKAYLDSPPVLRVLLVAVSLLAALWLGSNALALHDADEGEAALYRAKAGGWSPAELDRSRDQFENARRFGPDADVLFREASVLVFLGAPGRAVPLLERAVRAEPQNADAWLFLWAAVRGSDPARAAVARKKALELDPRARRRLDAG